MNQWVQLSVALGLLVFSVVVNRKYGKKGVTSAFF